MNGKHYFDETLIPGAPLRIRGDNQHHLYHPGRKRCATASGDDAGCDREIEIVMNRIYLPLDSVLYQEIHEKLQERQYFYQILSNMQYDSDHKGES